jgi:archaellum component FlaC
MLWFLDINKVAKKLSETDFFDSLVQKIISEGMARITSDFPVLFRSNLQNPKTVDFISSQLSQTIEDRIAKMEVQFDEIKKLITDSCFDIEGKFDERLKSFDQEIESIHSVLDAAKERLSRSRSELNALQLDDRIKQVLSSEQAESPNKISQLLEEHPSRIKHRLKKMIDSGLVSKRGRGKYFLASQVSEMFDE